LKPCRLAGLPIQSGRLAEQFVSHAFGDQHRGVIMRLPVRRARYSYHDVLAAVDQLVDSERRELAGFESVKPGIPSRQRDLT
jgi:hypothetical protein